jgi:signal transduction histidine kinase
VTATTPQDDVDVPPEAVAVVVRVLEEALANAHRHSGASLVRVDLALANRSLSVTVEDDGCGFDPHTAGGPHSGHLGLTLMRKRAREAHGELEMSSEPGGGTMVALRIPLEDSTRGGP